MALKRAIRGDAFRQFDGLTLVSRRAARGGPGGEHQAKRPSPSTDFVDYRPYQPGDDFRRVDWNVYGRLGSLQVKITEGRERLNVLLVLDCSSSMDFGAPDKLEFAAQLVAALAYVAMARADSVRIACLAAHGGRLGPFARRSRAHQLLGQLSKLAPGGLVDINVGIATCSDDPVLANALVVIVSDLLTPTGVASGLDALRLRGLDVAVIHVFSPQEANPQLAGELQLIDAESADVLELGVSQETLSAYRARFQTWLDARQRDCHGRGMRYARVATDRPLASVMMDDLRRAGLLR